MDTFATPHPPSPNAESIEVWNELIAPKFDRFRRILVDGVEPHGRIALDAFGASVGDRVLDLGCGYGETTIELARRVGGEGAAVGLDCCGDFLEVARTDAKASGLENVSFVEGDGQVWRGEQRFDLCFSRFGTMFFANPVAALSNLRANLEPGGRLVMLTWRSLQANPWLALAKERTAQQLPPIVGGRNCGPGPFSMSDPDVVALQLRSAGFTQVRSERIDAPAFVGRTVDEAVDFQLALGPAGELVREAGPAAAAMLPRLRSELESLMRPYASPRGVFMASSSWCTVAETS